MTDDAFIDVEVAYAQPDCQVIVPLRLSVGVSAREAVQRSGLLERFPRDRCPRAFGRRIRHGRVALCAVGPG